MEASFPGNLDPSSEGDSFFAVEDASSGNQLQVGDIILTWNERRNKQVWLGLV